MLKVGLVCHSNPNLTPFIPVYWAQSQFIAMASFLEKCHYDAEISGSVSKSDLNKLKKKLSLSIYLRIGMTNCVV